MTTAPPPVSGRRRRKLWIGLAVILAVAAAAVTWVVARPRSTPLPAIELGGLQPEAAAAVGRARADVEAQPRSGAAWGRLGVVLFANDLWGEALTCLREAERLEPADPRWPYYQGLILLRTEPEAAVAPLRRAADRGGSGDPSRLRLAEALLTLDRLDDAEELLRPLSERDPDNPRVRLGLGQVALERGRLRESLPDLRAAALSPFAQRAARASLAVAYQRLGDAKAAEEQRGYLRDLPPDEPWPDRWGDEVEALQSGIDARLRHAERLLTRGEGAKGIAMVEEVARDYPESDLPHQVMGGIYFRTNRPAEAEAELRRAIELNPTSPEHYMLLARVQESRNDDAGAAGSYRRATELKTDHAEAHYQLGRCRLRRHDAAGAAESFRAALRYQPGMTEAHVALAEACLELGRTDEARVHLGDALRLAPEHARAEELLRKIKPSGSGPSPRG